MFSSVTAVFVGSAADPVHLKVVLVRSSTVSQRTPSRARHPASGPWPTSLVHRKPPADLAKPVPGLYAPPPVSEAAPVGKPLMPVALKPKPVLPPAAHAGRRDQQNGRCQHRRHERSDLHVHLPAPLSVT